MRRLLISLGALALVPAAGGAQTHATPAPTPAAQPIAATTVVVSGRGWGHGVGMSQYGALGLANEGRPYAEILAHFYPGTELAPANVASIRVLVVEAARKATIASAQPFRLRDAAGVTRTLPPEGLTLGPGLVLPATDGGEDVRLTGPVTFLAGKAPLAVDGATYRGRVEAYADKGKLYVVNVLGLEPYLFGVVAREMPAAWHEEALKAQAVAARSYALAHRVRGQRFDVYADVRSQVYGGIAAEDPRTTAAIRATAGQALFHDGKIVDALFHSTSGGRTVSAAEAFGTDVPYLVEVDDPGSALSPVHTWGPLAVSAARARRMLKLDGPLLDLRAVYAPSGRARAFLVETPTGIATVRASSIRAALGLRSTWVKIHGVVSLSRPAAPVTFGKAVTLDGRVRGLAGATVSVRAPDGTWSEPKPLTPAEDGAFVLKARPKATVTYRVRAGTATTTLRVPVAPAVKLAVTGRTATGTARPVEPGATVELQAQTERGWFTMAETITDAGGRYSVALPEPGVYRARVAPGGGLVQGLSAAVEVP